MIKALLMALAIGYIISPASAQAPQMVKPEIIIALLCDTEEEVSQYLMTAKDAGDVDEEALEAISKTFPHVGGYPCVVQTVIALPGDEGAHTTDAAGRDWTSVRFLVLGYFPDGNDKPVMFQKPGVQYSAFLTRGEKT